MADIADESLPVEPTGDGALPSADRRRRIPEPPPVRLVTVEDAHLPVSLESEMQLDAFYVGLLKFERAADPAVLAYRAENCWLIFDRVDPSLVRDNLRPLGIEVQSLLAAEHALIDAGIIYERGKAMIAGLESLLLRDPAGNWIELTAPHRLR